MVRKNLTKRNTFFPCPISSAVAKKRVEDDGSSPGWLIERRTPVRAGWASGARPERTIHNFRVKKSINFMYYKNVYRSILWL